MVLWIFKLPMNIAIISIDDVAAAGHGFLYG
jgi:hypothetical protein